MQPETRYTQSGDVSIAYQVLGLVRVCGGQLLTGLRALEQRGISLLRH